VLTFAASGAILGQDAEADPASLPLKFSSRTQLAGSVGQLRGSVDLWSSSSDAECLGKALAEDNFAALTELLRDVDLGRFSLASQDGGFMAGEWPTTTVAQGVGGGAHAYCSGPRNPGRRVPVWHRGLKGLARKGEVSSGRGLGR